MNLYSNNENNAIDNKGFILWFTGLSGSGKTTLANAVKSKLLHSDLNITILDGDILREGLCSDLGYSKKDRDENIRRIGEVSKLLVSNGIIVFTACISPYREARRKVRNNFYEYDFLEIYCDCDINTCETRDPKGIYSKARRDDIINFTGITSPYEAPLNPDIRLNTSKLSVEEGVKEIIDKLTKLSLINPN